MPGKRIRPRSVQRIVKRRILIFSLFVGAAATLLVAIGYLASTYPSIRRIQQVHRHIFDEIVCSDATCDTHVFTTDWETGSADYIIGSKTRYFIDVPSPTEESPGIFAPLDYSDTQFIARFREPAWYKTPDEEVWRLYSMTSQADGKELDIIVGFAKEAPWKMVDTLQPDIGLVDATLRAEAEKLSLGSPNAKSARGAAVDGYEIVESRTQKVSDWGPWLPIFLPHEAKLPRPGASLYVAKGDLFVVQTGTDGRLLATSLVLVGSVYWLGILGIATFIVGSATASAFGRRYLRTYFALMTVRVPSLEDALKTGEGQKVEFKRGLSADLEQQKRAEEELLKSVAAFANTNDGVIFIGVDDGGRVVGLDLDFKQKDRLEQKIRQLARHRIRPIPPSQVGFEDYRGLVVAKIVVARGDAPAYLMGGVIYVRSGSSDVRAQPEDLKNIILAYSH